MSEEQPLEDAATRHDLPQDAEDAEIARIEALVEPKPPCLSKIVREIMREHPNWTYDQVNACLKLRTGKTVAYSTISRCRYAGLADKPTKNPKNNFTGATGPRRGVDAKGITEVMQSCVTVSDWQKITRKLVDLSIGGDLRAVEMLTNRMLGKPKEHSIEEKHTTNVNLNVLSAEEQAQLEYYLNKVEGKAALDYRPEVYEVPQDAIEDAQQKGEDQC
jgi:hypothetical protein